MRNQVLLTILSILFMVTFMGCQAVESDAPEATQQPPLNEEEKLAIQFAEHYFVRYDEQQLKKFDIFDYNPGNIFFDKSEINSVKPGKVKIASQVHEESAHVYIFVPQHLCIKGSRIEFLLQKTNSGYRIDSALIQDDALHDFEKFILTEFWQEKGKLLVWKDAELK